LYLHIFKDRTDNGDNGKGRYWTIDFTKKQDIKNIESSPMPGINSQILSNSQIISSREDYDIRIKDIFRFYSIF
jgi:hypothetical protein